MVGIPDIPSEGAATSQNGYLGDRAFSFRVRCCWFNSPLWRFHYQFCKVGSIVFVEITVSPILHRGIFICNCVIAGGVFSLII